jgi:D-serine deaminase-like pyridoxal phosphate-dependent protein
VTARAPDSVQHARLERATAGLDAPFVAVDLDAFDANAADLVRRAGGTPIRVASKSVRVEALLRRALELPGMSGILSLTLPEALHLVSAGVSDDIVVGYPSADRTALTALAAGADRVSGARVAVMADDVAQLDLLRACGADGSGPPVRVVLELDAGLPLAGGRVRIGVRRSPVHTPAQLAALASEVMRRPGLELLGVMGYEAQIAGLGDTPPGRRLRGIGLRALQQRSRAEIAGRRAAAVAAVERVIGGPLTLVNAGGTGSLESSAAESAVTEVAAGSGLLAPTLFDAYSAFSPVPALFLAVPVVRRPCPGVVTVQGGGWVASGAAGADRLPTPWFPAGLQLDGREGAGEAQTPVRGAPADRLAVGDRVWFRPTKAGEPLERIDRVHLVSGDAVVAVVPTYRGDGLAFG